MTHKCGENGQEQAPGPPLTPEQLSAWGRYAASRRRTVATTCVVCGNPITGLRRRKYCSGACRTKAYELRRRQTRPDPPSA